jgi:hypothetical protein
MSTAAGLENAGRIWLGWTVAVVGAGLMVAAFVIGMLIQREGDVAAPTRVAVGDATVPEATADYGIRHLEKSDARPLDAMADYGIRHPSEPGGQSGSESRARAGELDASADYGIRHVQPLIPRFTPEADYGIRHPQQIVRPLAREEGYGVRNGTTIGQRR